MGLAAETARRARVAPRHLLARRQPAATQPTIMTTKDRQFMVSEDGVHLMHGEYTLCGDAFDLADLGDEPDLPVMTATARRTVTCPKCIDVILLCRNVRIKRADA